MLKVGRVGFSFAAAHHLPGHDGACKNLHGHNYKLEVEFMGSVNRETGMVVDFKRLKDLVNDNVVRFLDHKNLNEVTLAGFPNHNPTAELMVQWMTNVLLGSLTSFPEIALKKIKLWETDNCYVEMERV